MIEFEDSQMVGGTGHSGQLNSTESQAGMSSTQPTLRGTQTLTSSQALARSQGLRRPPRPRSRPTAITDCRSTATLCDDAEEDDTFNKSPQARPRTHAGMFRPRQLSLSGSLSSLKATFTDPSLIIPSTPLPNRDEFLQVEGGVVIIFFDFDGTLTATPGDRAARCHKQAELCSRAPMIEPRLRALREAGATLGIISKSTEATIRDALQAAGLSVHFEAPVIGKAVSFEGKAGIIEELARKGALKKCGNHGLPAGQLVGHRVLLVDDDVLELERARSWGLQAYAAPSVGGLREEDFDVILNALRRPRHLPRPVGAAPSMKRSASHCSSSFMSANRNDGLSMLSVSKPGGKWRNLILFSGEAFEA